MRDLLVRSLVRDDAINEGDPGVTTFAMMSYWFGSLYVVVEGWQQLEFSDAAIDGLLSDTDKVEKLRRSRNATFHYQREIYHERFLGFMRGSEESSDWAHALNKAFDRFFTGWASEAGYLDDEVLKAYEEWKRKHPLARSGPP